MSRLTHSARKALPRSKFALPPKRSGPNKTPSTIKGRFPIDTIARARNADARAAQGVKKGTLTPAQAAIIRRRVHRAYPSIKQGGEAGK